MKKFLLNQLIDELPEALKSEHFKDIPELVERFINVYEISEAKTLLLDVHIDATWNKTERRYVSTINDQNDNNKIALKCEFFFLNSSQPSETSIELHFQGQEAKKIAFTKHSYAILILLYTFLKNPVTETFKVFKHGDDDADLSAFAKHLFPTSKKKNQMSDTFTVLKNEFTKITTTLEQYIKIDYPLFKTQEKKSVFFFASSPQKRLFNPSEEDRARLIQTYLEPFQDYLKLLQVVCQKKSEILSKFLNAPLDAPFLDAYQKLRSQLTENPFDYNFILVRTPGQAEAVAHFLAQALIQTPSQSLTGTLPLLLSMDKREWQKEKNSPTTLFKKAEFPIPSKLSEQLRERLYVSNKSCVFFVWPESRDWEFDNNTDPSGLQDLSWFRELMPEKRLNSQESLLAKRGHTLVLLSQNGDQAQEWLDKWGEAAGIKDSEIGEAIYWVGQLK